MVAAKLGRWTLAWAAALALAQVAAAAEPPSSDGSPLPLRIAAVPPEPGLTGAEALSVAQAEGAAAQPAAPAPERSAPAAGLAGKTVEAAQQVARSFRNQFLGQSITLGVADVLTGATLTTSAGTFESYTGPDVFTPAVAFNSASASGLITKEYDIGNTRWLDTISFLANYAQFSDNKQTVQNLNGRQSPSGFIRGDFLYGVALLAYNGIYEREGLNVAFRAGAGLGAALARFNGQIDYASGGQNVSETFSHDYSQPMLAYLLLVEARIGHIVVSGQSIEIYGDVKTNQTKTHFLVTLAVVTLQVGYAFYF